MVETAVCVGCGSVRAPEQFVCPVCATPANAAPKAPRSLALTFAGRYAILQQLGQGGFGVVYRARDERLGREVALKVFNEPLGADAEDRQRFEREALILASLDHPNIVTVFDAGIDGESPYFAMKLVRGGSLGERLRLEPMPPVPALTLMTQVATALDHAHAKGVVHRDIKPTNVLCDEEGRAYLADFGVSSAGFLPRMTRQGVVIGTLRYLSPEALSGDMSAAGDIYSLGTVLYEAIFGQPCFDQAEAPSLIRAICQDVPAMLRKPPAGVHPELVRFIEHLLAKDPKSRPPTASAVVAEAQRLRETLESTPNATTQIAAHTPDPTDAVEKLEKEAAAIASLCERSPDDLDMLLDHVSRYVRDAVGLGALVLRQGVLDDGVRHALTLSLVHMTREVERQLHRSHPVKEGTWPFSAPLFRLQKSILVPASALLEQFQQRERADEEVSDFFHFDEMPAGQARKLDASLIEKLRVPDDLSRHEAVLEVLTMSLETFVASLRLEPESDRDELLDVLWHHADLILLEARGRSRPLFEAGASLPADRDLAARWRELYALFRQGVDEPSAVRAAIEQRTAAQKKVFARSLLLHPHEEWRRFGLEILEPFDVWEVVSHPATSLQRLIDIWNAMRARGGSDFVKIFFACTRDTFMQPGGPERILLVIEMMKEFYEVDVFHEDVFFRMLMELDDWVKGEARRHHVLVDFDKTYVERLQNFLAGGVRKEQPIEGWRLVPLPIQRRLARLGHFVRHFACHPVESIALECLPHVLAIGNGMSFAAMFGINVRLLAELSKEKRLWMTDESRYALVANPKCPPPIVLKYIGYLRKDYLKKLADSREVNALARNTAERMLARRV